MNSRRKFLRNSGLAASVLLAAKPVKLMAGVSAPFTGNTAGKLLLLHTPGISNEAGELKRNASNAVLLHHMCTTKFTEENKQASINAGYDVFPERNVLQEKMHIIHKGGSKIGIIHNVVTETAEVNRLAKGLKQDHGCCLVIYLFAGKADKNEAAQLAERSEFVDMILSPTKNKNKPTFIALNRHSQEVIIDHADDSIGCIEVGFDSYGNKNHIAFGMPKEIMA